MNQNSKKIIALNKKLNKARGIYQAAISSVVSELEGMSGLDLVSNDFIGDGLGIGTNGDTYTGIGDLIEVIKEKGTFTEEDIFCYL